MEPLRSTGSFSRRVTVADGNAIVTILDLGNVNSKYETFKNDGYLVEIQALLEDLKITVNLPSLLTPPFPSPSPFGGEGAKQAELMKIRSEGQKISLGLYSANGNGPWRYESEVVLQNFGGAEHHVPVLSPFLSTNETLVVDGDWKLGVKVEVKWQQPLKASDFLVVRGSYRQIVSLVKKNDPELVALGDRISALESLLGFFGAATPTVAGTNGLVKGANIGEQSFLLRGDRTWQQTTPTGLALLNGSPASSRQALAVEAALPEFTASATAPLNIPANTWFTVGVINGVNLGGTEAVFVCSVYVQYGDGSVTFGHWMYVGGCILTGIMWKAGGAQLPVTFRMEVHNGADFNCSIRFGNASNVNRPIQVMFDVPITTQAPSLLRVRLKKIF